MAMLATSSFATVLYDFSYTPTTGTVSSFSFQITSDHYLTDTPSLEFTPFQISAGSDIFTFTKGTLSQNCFTFGGSGSNVGSCTGGPTPGNGVIQFGFGVMPINAPGTYTVEAIAGGLTSDFRNVNGFGTMTMVVSSDLVSDTPEPSTMALLGAGMVGIGVSRRFRKRLSKN